MVAGNLLPSQSSNGRRLTSSTSLGDHRASAGQDLHTEGSSCALGSLTSPSSAGDSAQELSEKVWGLLVEGLQPFMQWELQSGMGDLWEQVASLHLTSLNVAGTGRRHVHIVQSKFTIYLQMVDTEDAAAFISVKCM